MTRFEDDLRDALQRQEPPTGFADRVMARIPATPRRTWWMPRSAAAAALIAVLGAGTWEFERERQRRIEAERAKAELVQGLELTAQKIEAARSMLLRQLGGKT